MGVLSQRQRQCLVLVSEGLMYQEIAEQLGVSLSTVRGHLAAAALKAGVSGRGKGSLVAWAIRTGELTMPDPPPARIEPDPPLPPLARAYLNALENPGERSAVVEAMKQRHGIGTGPERPRHNKAELVEFVRYWMEDWCSPGGR